MTTFQTVFLITLIIFNVVLLFVGKYRCKNGCSFYLTRWLTPLGMFVWGDVLVLALFWLAAAIVSLVLSNWWLFLLLVSVFWLVRSSGETLYWFLQQFATKKRDAPESLVGYSLVKNESIWFIYQVMWQCLTVFSLVATIYTAYMWLGTL